MRETRPGEFATFIRKARGAMRMSQVDLAQASGIARSTIIRWENGQTKRPKVDEVLDVVDALEVSPADAFRAIGWLPSEEQESQDEFERRLRSMTPEQQGAAAAVLIEELTQRRSDEESR